MHLLAGVRDPLNVLLRSRQVKLITPIVILAIVMYPKASELLNSVALKPSKFGTFLQKNVRISPYVGEYLM